MFSLILHDIFLWKQIKIVTLNNILGRQISLHLNSLNPLTACPTLIYFRSSPGLKIRRPDLESSQQLLRCVTLSKLFILFLFIKKWICNNMAFFARYWIEYICVNESVSFSSLISPMRAVSWEGQWIAQDNQAYR